MQELNCLEENIRKITLEVVNLAYYKDIDVSTSLYCLDPNRPVCKFFHDLGNPNSPYYHAEDEDPNHEIWEKIDDYLNLFIRWRDLDAENKRRLECEELDIEYDEKECYKQLFNTFTILDIHYTIMQDKNQDEINLSSPYTQKSSGIAYSILNLSSSSNDNYPGSTNVCNAVFPTKDIHKQMFIDSLNSDKDYTYDKDYVYDKNIGIAFKVLHRLNYLINKLKNNTTESNPEDKPKRYKYMLTLPTILSRCRSVRMINITNNSGLQEIARKMIGKGMADGGRWKISDINKISPTMPLIASRSNGYNNIISDGESISYSPTITAADPNNPTPINTNYWDPNDPNCNVCDDDYVLELLKWFVDEMLKKVKKIEYHNLLDNFIFAGFYLEEFPTFNYSLKVINGIIDYIKEKNSKYIVSCAPTAEYYKQQKSGTDAYSVIENDREVWYGYHYNCPDNPNMAVWPKGVLNKCKFDDVYVLLNGGLTNRSNNNLEETLDSVYTNFLNFTFALDGNTVSNKDTESFVYENEQNNISIPYTISVSHNNLTGPLSRLKEELDYLEHELEPKYHPERDYLNRNWNFYCAYDALKYVYEFIDNGTINGKTSKKILCAKSDVSSDIDQYDHGQSAIDNGYCIPVTIDLNSTPKKIAYVFLTDLTAEEIKDKQNILRRFIRFIANLNKEEFDINLNSTEEDSNNVILDDSDEEENFDNIELNDLINEQNANENSN